MYDSHSAELAKEVKKASKWRHDALSWLPFALLVLHETQSYSSKVCSFKIGPLVWQRRHVSLTVAQVASSATVWYLSHNHAVSLVLASTRSLYLPSKRRHGSHMELPDGSSHVQRYKRPNIDDYDEFIPPISEEERQERIALTDEVQRLVLSHNDVTFACRFSLSTTKAAFPISTYINDSSLCSSSGTTSTSFD